MKAILLAAGVGNRISRDISVPKSMLKVDGVTIIERTVKMLVDNNIEVAIVVGYQKDSILSSLGHLPITYFYNPFYRITNSVASLWFAKDFLDESDDVILANADVFWEQPVLTSLINDSRKIVMLSDKTKVSVGDYFFCVEDEKLISHGKDLPLEERSCEYVGVAKIRKDFIPQFKTNLDSLIDEEQYNFWWENILYENRANFPVFVKDISEHFWSEVDYIEDYKRILDYTERRK